MVTGFNFVHFKKALNVINIVINHELSFYGASDLTVKWSRSYLTGKKLRAFVRVPQESIPGPILYIKITSN